MLLKTKLLLFLSTLGVFGGSGAGVYYRLKNHPITENATQKETEDSNSGSVGEVEDNFGDDAEDDDNETASELKVVADSHIA